MTKYIDTEKMKAEIERRLSYLHVESGQGIILTQELRNQLISLLSFTDSLQQEQPSLPSNLNEAAKNYATEYTENENGNGGDDWEDDIAIAFKDGAEWMAEQMITSKTKQL